MYIKIYTLHVYIYITHYRFNLLWTEHNLKGHICFTKGFLSTVRWSYKLFACIPTIFIFDWSLNQFLKYLSTDVYAVLKNNSTTRMGQNIFCVHLS